MTPSRALFAITLALLAATAGFVWAKATGRYDLQQACGYFLLVGGSVAAAFAMVKGFVAVSRLASGKEEKPVLFAELEAVGFSVGRQHAAGWLAGWPIRIGLAGERGVRIETTGVRFKRVRTKDPFPGSEDVGRDGLATTLADGCSVPEVLEAAIRLAANAEARSGRGVEEAVRRTAERSASAAVREAASRVLETAPIGGLSIAKPRGDLSIALDQGRLSPASVAQKRKG